MLQIKHLTETSDCFFLLLTRTAARRKKCCGNKLSSCADLLRHLLLLDHPIAASEHSLAATASHL